MLRKDREGQKENGHGAGGVLIYIKNHIKVIERKEFQNENFKESLWCDIYIGKFKLLLGVCYRPPNFKEDTGLNEILYKASKEFMLVMGDFNYHINWNTLEGERPEDINFINVTNDNFLFQHITDPTRGKNTLDLILTTDENLVEGLTVGEHFGTSDHQVVRWNIYLDNEDLKKENLDSKNFFKADYDKIRNELEKTNLAKKIESANVEEAWAIIKKELNLVVDKYIPSRGRTQKRQPWLTKEVIKCKRAKYKAWKKLREMTKINSGEEEERELKDLKQKYQKQRNASNRINKKALLEYENKLAKNVKSDSKSFFRYVRCKQKVRDKIGPLQNSEGQTVDSVEETTNILNIYFSFY